VEEARNRRVRGVRTLVVVALSVVVAIAIVFAMLNAAIALYEYRSDKVTGDSDRARGAWAQIRAGMSEADVADLAGGPSARHGSCWTWGEGWFSDAVTVFEVCFEYGNVIRKSMSSSSLDGD
jgi:hypothetical protein